MAAKRTNSATKSTGDSGKKQAANSKAANNSRKTKAPDKRKVRAMMEAAVLKKGKAVIEAVIKEAEKGGYLPAKYLFEFAGIAEPLSEPETDAGQRAGSLMEILLATAKSQQNESESSQAEETLER